MKTYFEFKHLIVSRKSFQRNSDFEICGLAISKKKQCQKPVSDKKKYCQVKICDFGAQCYFLLKSNVTVGSLRSEYIGCGVNGILIRFLKKKDIIDKVKIGSNQLNNQKINIKISKKYTNKKRYNQLNQIEILRIPGSRLERVFPRKYSFGSSVTEELPLPRGVGEELALNGLSKEVDSMQCGDLINVSIN